jgi:sporulation protein YlmC with PRC-barrel domain
VDLIRDLLDKQLIDRNGRNCGKVDGVVLVIRDGRPRVESIEVGWLPLARRLGKRIAHWSERAMKRWSARNGEPYRLPFSKVLDVGKDVDIDLDAERSTILSTERWLRKHVVSHIPGGSSGKE